MLHFHLILLSKTKMAATFVAATLSLVILAGYFDNQI